MRIVLITFECGHHGWRVPGRSVVYNGTTQHGRQQRCVRCTFHGSEYTNAIWIMNQKRRK